MAEDKKKIVVYADWLTTFNALTDEEAGKLIKHFFQYVNDLNPQSDRLTELMFTPIKQTLKRDLQKWQDTRDKRVEAGSKGGKQKVANATNAKQSVANVAVSDSVNVSVSDSVNVNENKETYRRFAHLCLSVDDFNKLAKTYTTTSIDSILDSIENYKGNIKYKSLYLTAKKWLEKEGKKIMPQIERISL